VQTSVVVGDGALGNALAAVQTSVVVGDGALGDALAAVQTSVVNGNIALGDAIAALSGPPAPLTYGGGRGVNDNVIGVLTGGLATPASAPVQTLQLNSPSASVAPAADIAALIERIGQLEDAMRELAALQLTVERDGMAEVANEVRALRRPLERVAIR